MKHIALILITIFFTCDAITPTPYLATRSQGQDAVRDLIGMVPLINKPGCTWYSVAAITPTYSESFFQNRIADNLFGNDLASDTLSAITVTGSGVKARNANGKEWLADYFGLPRDHSGTMRFEPIVSNVTNDLFCYLGMNNIAQGLFATIHIPVVHTKWDLNFFEVINTDGTSFYPPGYFSPIAKAEFNGTNMQAVGVPRPNLLNNIADFLFWQQTPAVDPVVFEPLQQARIVPKGVCGHRVKSGIADIQTVLGWNFIQKKWCHLGAGIRTVIPTGTRPNGQFLFEPTIGNGHHWELGTQIWGHRTLCISENQEEYWTAYFLLHIMHMFQAQQCRTFDLICKPNSRWMLAQKMTPQVQHLEANAIPNDLNPTNLQTPDAQFAALFSPVANITTRSVRVSSNVQCDGVLMLSYIKKHLSIDFGYNGWYRSCEKISYACRPTVFETEQWALKGDSYVYGFTQAQGIPPVPDNTPVALSATQSNATIHSGTNNFIDLNGNTGGIDGIRPTRNPGVDNPAFAAATFNGTAVFLNDRITVPPSLIDAEQTETSFNPIFLQENQLDLCNAQTKGFSNKLFFHLSYWFDTTHPCLVPFFGFGFAFEIGNKNVPQDRTKETCQNSALSQFAVWLRTGFSFN